MSHTRVKTKYAQEGVFGSTDYVWLYCHHNHSSDYTSFYDDRGDYQTMCFGEWEDGNDLWDAVERLWFPFKEEWGKELKDDVEYWNGEFTSQ